MGEELKSEGMSMCLLKSPKSKGGGVIRRGKANQESRFEIKVVKESGEQHRMKKQ